MLVFEKISDLKAHLSELKEKGKSIGFVPTMGALHQGHASLVERSVEENDITVASIFVNPIQFNKKEDLQSYPRDKEGDVKLLASLDCDVLFHPSAHEMYPEGEDTKIIHLGSIENILEGEFRPGHFAGVCTVVKKLFDIVSPNRAYFGLKDYQQFAVIKLLSEKFELDVEVVGCETKREENGLAMSSRNLLLSEEGRQKAVLFSQSLLLAKNMISTIPLEEIRAMVKESFKNNEDCDLEYFEIADSSSLESVQNIRDHTSVIGLIAGYIEGVRLIDNLILFP